ncbi:MAG: MarC family protein [Gemmatimonadota bacterium]|nr:MarC family protein [Gemmatimonadota bacterium]
MSPYIAYAVTMLTIINPVGTVAIFAGMAGDRPVPEQKEIARSSAFATSVVMILVTWSGAAILAFFGVTPPGLQAAGGVILILMGLAMLSSTPTRLRHTPAEDQEAHDRESIAVVPLAIPITIGPGAITTIILFSQELPGVVDRLVMSGMAVLFGLLMWLVLHFSGPIANRLGVTGVRIVTRIMGLLLVALAFQMLADGLRELLPGLAG